MPDTPKRVVLPFRIREDLVAEVERIAARKGKTRARYVEDVVTAAVKRDTKRAA